MITIDDIKDGYLLKTLEKMTNYEFNIVTDIGAYVEPRRSKNTLKQYVNGMFMLRGVDIQRLSDGREAMGFEFILDFLIPVDDRAILSYPEQGSISSIYQSVMDFRNTLADVLAGSTVATITKNDKTYTGGVLFNLPTVGQNSIRQGVGNSVTYSCSISLALLDGGINTAGLKLKIQDEIVPYSSIKITRNPALSSDLMNISESSTASVYAESTQLKIDFSAPAIDGSVLKEKAFAYLFGTMKANDVLAVSIGDSAFNMIFGGCEMQGSGVSNLSFSISLVPYTAAGGGA